MKKWEIAITDAFLLLNQLPISKFELENHQKKEILLILIDIFALDDNEFTQTDVV